MISCSPVRTYVRYVAHTSASIQRVMPRSTFRPCCFQSAKVNYVAKSNPDKSFIGSDTAKQRSNRKSLTMENLVHSRRWQEMSCLDRSINMNSRLLLPRQGIISRKRWSLTPLSASLVLGLSIYNSISEPARAEAKPIPKDDSNSSTSNLSHGKQVHTNYSVIGIPGDGRCLFRAVAHGACICSGNPAPGESQQRELADQLRAKVADEFVKRRKETEWFIEGDFDAYVSEIRKSHVWGGEPELLMASHVLKMPIIVYMNDPDSGGVISIAKYGQEYNRREDGHPIRVLYHGFGHYDALHVPVTDNKDPRSRL